MRKYDTAVTANKEQVDTAPTDVIHRQPEESMIDIALADEWLEVDVVGRISQTTGPRQSSLPVFADG